MPKILLLHKNLVILEGNLGAPEWNVKAAVAGMHLARRQTTLVEGSANVQGLPSSGVTADYRAWWNGSVSTWHPARVRYIEDLELVLQDFLSVPTNVHGMFGGHELSRDLLSFVEGAGQVNLRSIDIVACNQTLVGYSLTGGPAHPAHGGHGHVGSPHGNQHLVLQ